MARKPRFTWYSDAAVAVYFSRFNLGGIFEVLRDAQPSVNQSDS